MNDPIIRYLGDIKTAISRKSLGLQLLGIVYNAMNFQGLKIHRMERRYVDGTIVVATVTFNISVIYIYCPLAVSEQDKKKTQFVEKYMLQHVLVSCYSKSFVWCADLNRYTDIDGIDWDDGPVDSGNVYLVAWKAANEFVESETDPWTVDSLTYDQDSSGWDFLVPPCDATDYDTVVTGGTVGDPCLTSPDLKFTSTISFGCTQPTSCNVGGNHSKSDVYTDVEWNCLSYHDNEGTETTIGSEDRPAIQHPSSNNFRARAFNLINNYSGADGYSCCFSTYAYSSYRTGCDPAPGTIVLSSEAGTIGHKTHLGTIYSGSLTGVDPSSKYNDAAIHLFKSGIADPTTLHGSKVAAVQIFGIRCTTSPVVSTVQASCELVNFDEFKPDLASENTDFADAVDALMDDTSWNSSAITLAFYKSYNFAYKGQLITQVTEEL
jgi:hypothetical protein